MCFLFLLLLLVSPLKPTIATAVSMSSTTVIHLGDIAYYMRQESEPTLSVGDSQTEKPCTLFKIDTAQITRDSLQETISRFEKSDDVWSKKSLLSIVWQFNSTELADNFTLQPDAQNFLEQLGNQNTYSIQVLHQSRPLEGPYFLKNGKLHAAYRLYPDTAGAFIVSTVQTGHDPFQYQSLNAAAYGETFPSSLTIAVPSRLHFSPTKEKPYAGLRIGVKDIIDLKGLRTGGSSRAYTQLYGPRRSNATVFADSEWPTGDWVDYHAPFNPVADGYQGTSGSSAGSAAAIASYPWLDFAIGTDTLGSTRAPATAQGIFGIRPSLDASAFEGVISYSSKFDTIGGFARSAESLAALSKALYSSTSDTLCTRKPKTILYPEQYWPVAHPESQTVFENFLVDLKTYLDIKRTPINLEKISQETKPVDTDLSLQDYFEHVFECVANPDQWNGFFKQFLQDYEATYGRRPLLNPQLQFKRDYLPTITAEDQAKGLELLNTFQTCYEANFIPPSTDGCSDTILVSPWSQGDPDYRDKYGPGAQKFTGIGYFFYNHSPYAESPEITVPAGKTSYLSRVTHMEEWLPACIGIIGSKGSDVRLAEIVRDFMRESNRKEVDAESPSILGKQHESIPYQRVLEEHA